MSQADLRHLIRSERTATRERFFDLPVIEQLRTVWEIFRLQASLIFSQKFIWFLLGIVAYMVLRYIGNYHTDVINRVTQQTVIPELLAFPMVVLAILTNMFLISIEKENRTLEGMFTLAGSRYRIWLLRIATLHVILFGMTFALSLIAFFTFTDMAILGTSIHVFVPVFLVANLTLYFSVKFRSALGAGMLAVLALLFSLIFHEILSESGLYRYLLFFNPYALPRDIDPATWNTWMWQNRIGVMLIGCGFLYAALRKTDQRERLLQ